MGMKPRVRLNPRMEIDEGEVVRVVPVTQELARKTFTDAERAELRKAADFLTKVLNAIEVFKRVISQARAGK